MRHRVVLEAGLRVFDPDTGEDLGALADLSDRGMLLHGPHSYEPGTRGWFELRLEGLCSDAVPHLEAECAWARPNEADAELPMASGWRFTGEMNGAARGLLVVAIGRLRRSVARAGLRAS